MKQSMRYATILALSTAVISGTNNFLTKIAVTAVKDPIVFTTLKNALVAVFIIGIMLAFKKWKEISSLTKTQLLKLVAIGIIGGSLPFALYFTVLAANLLVGGFSGFKYNAGELMIFAATILWAVENIIAKIALRDLSGTTVAAARMTLGSIILIGIAAWRGGGAAVLALNPEQWGWTLLTSIFLLGYVLTWYTALKYAPATYVATLLVPATLITNILSAIFITHAFSIQQFISAVLFITGTALVVLFAKKITEEAVSTAQPKTELTMR